MKFFKLFLVILMLEPTSMLSATYTLLVGGTELSNVTDQIPNGDEGQLLLGQGLEITPAFVTPTAGDGLIVTSDATTLQYALSTPVSVANGGSGATTLTNHGVLLGQATSAIAATAVGATNTVLLGNTGADPSFGQVPNAALANSSVTLNNGNNISVTGSPISLGGTATVALSGTTNHGVQVGNASGSLTSLGVGTNGQVLVGATGADPAFVTPTAGTGLSVTANATTHQYALSTPVSVANGGSGTSTLTSNGVLLGNGTSAVSATAAGTNGQVLLGTTSGAPTFVTPTAGTGLSVTANATTHQYALSTPVSVANGGTGLASTTAYAVMCGGTTNTAALQSVASVGTAGQILTSNGAGALPTFQTVVQTATVTLTSAQVKALRAIPITIVAAPGANKVVNVLSCFVKLKYGGINPFIAKARQTLRLGYVGIDGTVIVKTAMANTSLDAVNDRIAFSTVDSDTGFDDLDDSLATNAAVVIYNSVATEISGNAANNNSIVVSVTYQIVDVS